ncbi:MAG: ORF6C domain-containing protein [Roseburia sp.]|nr:ORF6C domain-containing protein [Roseburia sp.]
MNETRTIPFEGGELLGVRTEDGQVWLAVRKACLDIGLPVGQARRQVENIQREEPLKSNCRKFATVQSEGTKQVKRAQLFLNESVVTLWLAKIALTPTMKKENPEVYHKLLQYQLKAANVLHEAFAGTAKQTEVFYQEMGLSGQIQEVKADVSALTAEVKQLIDTVTINTHQQQELSKLARSRVSALLGGTTSPEYKQMAKTYFKRLWISVCDALHYT